MKVKLTNEQVLQLAANAVNAAAPMGLGFLQHEEKEYQPEDMKDCLRDTTYMGRTLGIDYFHGRMIKLSAHMKNNDEWEFPDRDPTPDYQSWCGKYPTYQSLVDSVL